MDLRKDDQTLGGGSQPLKVLSHSLLFIDYF